MAAPPAEAAPTTTPVQNSSLYVGDLDRDATEASLFELFSQVRLQQPVVVGCKQRKRNKASWPLVNSKTHGGYNCMPAGGTRRVHPRLP